MPEIERKFRIDDLTAVPADLGGGTRLRQAYVAVDGQVEVRVRDTGGAQLLTVKGGRGVSRTEVELAIDAGAFGELWALGEGRRIDKVRHEVPLDGGGDPGAGLVAEVDVYGGALTGLVVVEVEFGSEDDAAAFVPPPWFGAELTGDDRWSNASLATHGAPASTASDEPVTER